MVSLLSCGGRVGPGSGDPLVLCQAAVAVPVIWFQVVNRSVISRRYSWAESRWRPGRKCGEMPRKADRKALLPWRITGLGGVG